MDMAIFVFYDVVEDKLRKQLAEVLADFGLERFQYSGFRGRLSSTRRRELWAAITRTLGVNEGRIIMLPICEDDLKRGEELVNGPASE